jgi:alpha-amylase
MAQNIVIYLVLHQPRRLRLPAFPIPIGANPADMARALFDERMNRHYFEKAAQTSYRPTVALLRQLVDEGFKINLGFSFSFLRQCREWDPVLLEQFRKLVADPNVELVAVEPYHSFIMLLDLPAFIQRMEWGQSELKTLFGKIPRVADTTEMALSDGISHALELAGFEAGVMDGRSWVLGWREPTYLYHPGSGRKFRLFTRHVQFSDDVGYRFTNRGWSGWPLLASTYADWLAMASGEFIFLGWDFETFGEHHRVESGIFDFLRWFPREAATRGLTFLSVSEVLDRYRDQAFQLSLPAFPTTWAGSGGMEFFLGNSVQQAVFQLMGYAYNKALLTEDRELIDLATWLCQSDNLHLIQWYGRTGPEAEVSAYFTPHEWWKLGPQGITWEIQQVYKNWIASLDSHLTHFYNPDEENAHDRTNHIKSRAGIGAQSPVPIRTYLG